MDLTLKEIGERFNLNIKGNAEKKVTGVNDLVKANDNQLAFVANEKQLSAAKDSRAGGFIVNNDWELTPLRNRNLLLTSNPKLAFAKIQGMLKSPEYFYPGVHPKAHVEDSVSIADRVEIYPFVYVGAEAEIEEGVVIYPNVFIGERVKIKRGTVIHSGCSIYSDCEIGKCCIIHSGTVIGADGFGFVKDGIVNIKIPQVGKVVIGDDCEIGANNTIDRATFGETRIGNNVKTDNLVHIAHNCIIGDNSMIIACSGVAGSTKFGKNVLMAGSSGVIDHKKIGDNTIIGTHSIVTRDMPAGKIWTGYPAFEHKSWLRATSLIPKLPELVRRIRKIESYINKKKV